MGKVEYSEKLQNPRWQKVRLKILERDNWTCQLCGDTESTLNIHHLKYHTSGNPWDVEDKYLITYCRFCHAVVSKSDLSQYPIDKIHKYTLANGAVWVYALHKDADPDKKSFISVYEIDPKGDDVHVVGIFLINDVLIMQKLLNTIDG